MRPMFRLPTQGPFRKLRLAVLGLFVVGVLAQSLLGVLGGVHEITGHDGHLQAAGAHLVNHDDGAESLDGESGESAGWHLLLHHMNCCGHTAWMSSGVVDAALHSPIILQLPGDPAQRIAVSRITAPFRPPIQA